MHHTRSTSVFLSRARSQPRPHPRHPPGARPPSIETRRAFIINTIPPQGIGAVSLISEGPDSQWDIVFMMNTRPDEIFRTSAVRCWPLAGLALVNLNPKRETQRARVYSELKEHWEAVADLERYTLTVYEQYI